MDMLLFQELEEKIERLVREHAALKQDYLSLQEENRRLLTERDGVKSRIDAILRKLEEL